MTTFYPEITARLKQGSIKNVYMFGDSLDRYEPPYVVVKPLLGGDRKVLQFFARTRLGEHEKLEAYSMRELPRLLKESIISGTYRITLYDTKNCSGLYVDSADNTLGMSRDFYVPVIG
jgi:hypothetical protein